MCLPSSIRKFCVHALPFEDCGEKEVLSCGRKAMEEKFIIHDELTYNGMKLVVVVLSEKDVRPRAILGSKSTLLIFPWHPSIFFKFSSSRLIFHLQSLPPFSKHVTPSLCLFSISRNLRNVAHQ